MNATHRWLWKPKERNKRKRLSDVRSTCESTTSSPSRRDRRSLPQLTIHEVCHRQVKLMQLVQAGIRTCPIYTVRLIFNMFKISTSASVEIIELLPAVSYWMNMKFYRWTNHNSFQSFRCRYITKQRAEHNSSWPYTLYSFCLLYLPHDLLSISYLYLRSKFLFQLRMYGNVPPVLARLYSRLVFRYCFIQRHLSVPFHDKKGAW